MVALTLMLVGATAAPAPPVCLKPGDDVNQVSELPENHYQLVGVAVDFQRGSHVVVRWGNGMNQSRVYRLGEKIGGRLEVFSIGAASVLLRSEGRFYVLKLKGRTTRDWRREVARLPRCQGGGRP
ncbi:MAG: hypothetical protein AB2A00_39045 [Myxococcota bacterium]